MRVRVHTQCKHITHTHREQLPIFGFDKVGHEGHERMQMSDFAHFFVGSVGYVDIFVPGFREQFFSYL